MALLFESFCAFAYQSGIDSIQDAFVASITTMEEAERKANEAHMNYAMGDEDDREYDEDRVLIRSTVHELEHAAMQVSYAAREVRKAFITSAFHYWERSARGWTNLDGQNDNYGKLKRETMKKFVMSPKLDELNHLNNVIKHNSPYHARLLANIRSDHFWRTPYSVISTRRATWALSITNAHVEEAIAIVRASGPQLA